MPIFKVLIIGTQIEKRVHPMVEPAWSYDVEHRAYSNHQFFSSEEKAKAFCQQYSPTPMSWEMVGDFCWTADYGIYNFNVYIEEGAEMDTLSMPPLPNKFAEHQSMGD